MLSSWVSLAYINGLENMALTEKKENVQVCVRIIVVVKKADNIKRMK